MNVVNFKWQLLMADNEYVQILAVIIVRTDQGKSCIVKNIFKAVKQEARYQEFVCELLM